MEEVDHFTFTKGRLHLGIKQERFDDLLKLIDIPEFGEEEPPASKGYGTGARVPSRRIRIARSLRTKEDLWNAIWARGHPIDDDEGIAAYRMMRRALVGVDHPHPPQVALALVEMMGRRPKKHEAYKRLGGTFATMEPVMQVIDHHLGNAEKLRVRGWRAREMTVDELIARQPVLARLEATCLDPEFSRERVVPAKLIGRVELMLNADLETVLALFLLVGPGRLAPTSIERSLIILEHLDEVAREGAPALGDAMVALMRRVCIDDERRLSKRNRHELLLCYDWMRGALVRWLDEVPDERRSVFRRFVPPALPSDLRIDAALEFGDVRDERVERRAATAAPISETREAIISATEAVYSQLNRLVSKIEVAKRRIRERLANGGTVKFPVTVSDTHAVVRRGLEGLGSGRQTIRVQIETTASLWRQCARHEDRLGGSIDGRAAWGWIDARTKGEMHPLRRNGGMQVDGDRWDPAFETALQVVYVGTSPVEPGGECVEPVWVDLFRSRLFDPDPAMTSEERAERERLVDLIGFDPIMAPSPGMLTESSRSGKPLGRAYRRFVSTERFVFPAEEFRHACLCGRLVLRAELLRGMRIGESSQARSDGFDFRRFGGKTYFYLSAIPKMGRGNYRRMVLDPVTVRAFEDLRLIAMRRWFSDRDDLPVRPFHDVDRPDVKPMRYLMVNAEGMLGLPHLNLYLRILTVGIVSSTSHSYKYGFAALLKRSKAPTEFRNRALNHALGSPVSEDYARFATEHDVDAFIAEQQEASAKAQLEWELLE